MMILQVRFTVTKDMFNFVSELRLFTFIEVVFFIFLGIKLIENKLAHF